MIYRKLPGRRRGLIRGASVWLGPDHLLAVRSWRFREEYKRYYLREVQAIVVANAMRFHVSTRAIAIAAMWLIAALVLGARFEAAVTPLWDPERSARTGVDPCVRVRKLPVPDLHGGEPGPVAVDYRRWTARKFLRSSRRKSRRCKALWRGTGREAVGPARIGDRGAACASIATPARERGSETRSWATDLLTAGLWRRRSPEPWALANIAGGAVDALCV